MRVAIIALAVPAVLLGAPGASPTSAGEGRTSSARATYADERLDETVHAVRRIGISLRGRPIRAYRLGAPGAGIRAVVLGSMHGDERAGTILARAIINGRPVRRIRLWVIPTMNPDGLARGTRGNAHGVDLNRNWRRHWAHLTGPYYSGRHPFSEPESRALRDFLARVRPRFVVSFHQPLHAVGRAGERPALTRRLSRQLGLPRRHIGCSGVCHGTMTDWYNHRFAGTAVTVELGAHPPHRYLTGRAARGTVRAVLGSTQRR